MLYRVLATAPRQEAENWSPDTPNSSCSARGGALPQVWSHAELCRKIESHIEGSDVDASCFVSLSRSLLWCVFFAACAIKTKKAYGPQLIAEVCASDLGDFAVNCSTEEASRMCGITSAEFRKKAVCASEVLVTSVPEAALTRRVLCVDPRSELGQTIVHDIIPNDQERDDSGMPQSIINHNALVSTTTTY